MAKDERSNEELMLAYRGGQASAYRVLVERHHAPLYRFCLRALKNTDAAADATQEVFLRVVKHAKTWEPKAKFTTWLYTMAKNHCIDEVRKAKFRKTDSLHEPVGRDGDGGEEKLDRVASEVPASDRLVDNGKLRRVLDRAIDALPEEQRAVFLLREQAGLQFKEIAVLTGVGENTVKSRMRYALGMLQRHLQDAGFALRGGESSPATAAAATEGGDACGSPPDRVTGGDGSGPNAAPGAWGASGAEGAGAAPALAASERAASERAASERAASERAASVPRTSHADGS